MIHWLERFHILLFLGASATLTPSRGSGQLPYQVLGEGEPTVVVLHGGPGVTHDYLRPEWDRLAEVARVVYYDQRGCGSGSGELGPVTWQRHVDDLRVLIGEVSPEGVVLAGSSWGSSLALLFSIEHPDLVQALVLSGLPTWPTVVRGDSSVPPRLETRLDSLERSLPVDPWPQPDTLGSGGEVSAIAADERVSSRVVACPEAGGATFESLRTVPNVAAVAEIPAAALIFQGLEGRGRYEWGGQLSRYLLNSEHIVVRGAAHDPWASHPDDFFGRVSRFLEELQLIELNHDEAGRGVPAG